MTNKKNTGSYYTPQYLAEFITKRVMAHAKTNDFEILEPSVGDGAFVSELSKVSGKNILLEALDINQEELQKAASKWKDDRSFFNVNFLDFETDKKYSVILGNPPYIKKKLLREEDLEKIKLIHQSEHLSENSVNNIWTTFIIKSCRLLTDDGIIAFVLPSELLQVKYAREIREMLIKKFERIEILTFNDLMFECKGQDTIVLFGYLKHSEKGQYFTNIESQEQLVDGNFTLKKNEILIENDTKWSHHFLNKTELNFLQKLKNRVHPLSHYSDSKPGIVTAANNFFIIDDETEEKYSLQDYTYPIIKRGLFVNGSVIFNQENMNSLREKKLPTKLLYIKESDDISKGLLSYLKTGEEQELHKRYKCSIRNKWYVIPNVSVQPEAIFFKRAHLYPKLLKNEATAYVTDSAYKIEIKENYDIDSFIFSFYNSLTLLFAELEGRFYGGGVLELIPSEFKNLPLPYVKIDQRDFVNFVHHFENKESIDDILQENNLRILSTALGLNQNEINKIEKIRLKLITKRTRKKSTYTRDNLIKNEPTN
ncbi:Eco57I restriction-modification methylase domain-containing protein [Chryseobacterium indologenes]|uniref:class I SAM-dependent methyltransferase n=1 Tax=Chryseobacterium indologenes TaxID=253 RepID=UPI0021A96C2E|nr:N-6 DNA methylase [Elizabethkingia anophelis]